MTPTDDNRPLGDKPRDRALLFVAVAVVALLAHVRSIGGPFVWDGGPPRAQTAAVQQLDGMSTTPTNSIHRPVRAAYMNVMHAVFGGSAGDFRAAGLLLHAINATLLCALANALFRQRPLAAICGFLFAVHPVHVEAVSGAANAGELLTLAFALAAFLIYSAWVRTAPGKSERTRSIALYVLALAAFSLAMLAKESAIVLPLFLLSATALGVWRARRKAVLGIVPFLLAAAAYGAFRYLNTLAQQCTTGITSVGPATLAERLILALRTTGVNLRLLALPSPLNPWHTFASKGTLASPTIAILGIFGILAILLIANARRLRDNAPALVFGILWTLLALAPVSNLILPDSARPVAEHRLYTPSAGWCFALGTLLFAAVSHGGLKSRRVAGLACGTLIMLMLAMTSNYTEVWHDRMSLWTTAASRSPRVAQVQENLGRAYLEAGRPAQAAANDAMRRSLVELQPIQETPEDASQPES